MRKITFILFFCLFLFVSCENEENGKWHSKIYIYNNSNSAISIVDMFYSPQDSLGQMQEELRRKALLTIQPGKKGWISPPSPDHWEGIFNNLEDGKYLYLFIYDTELKKMSDSRANLAIYRLSWDLLKTLDWRIDYPFSEGDLEEDVVVKI